MMTVKSLHAVLADLVETGYDDETIQVYKDEHGREIVHVDTPNGPVRTGAWV